MQRSLLTQFSREESVILELTVPIEADLDVFRIGWSLRGHRSRRWIALSTGSATWSKLELRQAAVHMESILACAVDLVDPPADPHRR